MHKPRIIIAGLNGGTGKTITSLGTTRAWVRKGLSIKPFKKGPDYIDAKWLGLAALKPATNLDPYLLSDEMLRALFRTSVEAYDGALIEGNRGLFDGKDLTGTCSTAELARILDTPVILAMDCTKMTRTAAAIVSGIINFEEGVRIAGVILNRTANDRHRSILRQTIEHYTGVPVLGALPKMRQNPIPERHMGLISDQEYDPDNDPLDTVADLISDNCDVDAMWQAACSASPVPAAPDLWSLVPVAEPAEAPVRIGYVRDAALWFYYEENLQALRHAGAELVELSLLSSDPWPELDALYLGGGFPETLAQRIADNTGIREHIKALAESGLPIYAECGGFMVLSRSLVYQGTEYPMTGVFPVSTHLCERPQGLGYIDATVTLENPYHPTGSIIKGHEFHYSKCVVDEGAEPAFGLQMDRGFGMGSDKDGLVYKNVFASYTHLFALGEPHWAVNLVLAARKRRASRA
ncbi:cobyrinate a,c-diamide synthase [Desulfovibrio mangrovi]|uniref:cobyrinate a,c-diamide synthase n=1 Tax=Desulfovibrio mangrovi TaxID=2976983 RepID=UPI0022452216|nr:cobyrinate a,c-diamide synthase [Desulfovibrio mangrovi]UZP66215.1 cobyrinate a,c-diamide synthase [Desulfovibrio mangrovi]